MSDEVASPREIGMAVNELTALGEKYAQQIAAVLEADRLPTAERLNARISLRNSSRPSSIREVLEGVLVDFSDRSCGRIGAIRLGLGCYFKLNQLDVEREHRRQIPVMVVKVARFARANPRLMRDQVSKT